MTGGGNDFDAGAHALSSAMVEDRPRQGTVELETRHLSRRIGERFLSRTSACRFRRARFSRSLDQAGRESRRSFDCLIGWTSLLPALFCLKQTIIARSP